MDSSRTQTMKNLKNKKGAKMEEEIIEQGEIETITLEQLLEDIKEGQEIQDPEYEGGE